MYPSHPTVTERDADFELDAADLRRRLFERDDAPRRAGKAAAKLDIALAVTETVRARVTAEESFALDPDVVIGQLRTAEAGHGSAVVRAFCTVAPFVAGDLIALAAAGLLASFVVPLVAPAAVAVAAPHPAAWVFAAAVLVPLLVTYWLGGLYSELWLHPVIELRHLTHLTSVCLLAAGTAGLLAPPLFLWCAVVWPAALVLVPLARAVVRTVCARRDGWGYRTLIIGSTSLAKAVLRSPKSGLRPVLMTDPQTGCRTSVLPVVNDPDTLRSLVQVEGIRHAVVSLPDFPSADLARAIDLYAGVIPHMLVLSDSSTLPALWSTSRSSGRLSGIEVRNGLLFATLQWLKRLLDLTVSLAVLVVGAPLLAGIILAIKLTDPGPVFFGHTRIGQHGRRFKTWKFRTMRVGADALLNEHLALHPAAQIEWEQTQKLRDDPRVTRVGRFLRRTSLDELPQIWNVLRGEMSLVGPRPIVDDEVWRYGDVIRLYAAVKPGITGLWQASGRTDLSYDDRVLLDQFYVRHWSPWLDVFVLAKTVVALLCREGAY